MVGAKPHEPEYIAVRRVPFDALKAVEPHCKVVAMVGTQAIYLHAREADWVLANEEARRR